MAQQFKVDALAGGLAGLSLSDITMVESEIDKVISMINEESAKLLPVKFAFAGLVAEGSFGGADSAPKLALHYSKAHEVTWKTLMGVKDDLENFQEACRLAKLDILEADQSSQDQMRAVTNALDGVASSNVGRNSDSAYDGARNGDGGAEG